MQGQTYRYISALWMTVLTPTKGYGISTYYFALTDRYTNKNSRAPRVPGIRLYSEIRFATILIIILQTKSIFIHE